MIINLQNKSKVDNEQNELQNMSLLKFIFKGKSIFFDDADDEILLLLLYVASITIGIPLGFSLFHDVKYSIMSSIIFFALLFIFIVTIEYNIKKGNKLNSTITQKLQEQLNEKYVFRDDHEKVYLLHELIKKYDLEYSSTDQSNDARLKLELNTNNFIKLEPELYKDEDVYTEIKDNVLNDQTLSEDEVQRFYYKYIDHKIKPEQKRIKSLDEYNVLSQRLKNKNKRY